ncbi:hypothetical protein BABINDRAFT_159913 [Babjeviella inositovora NRRL Y-12698]|uniref:Cysteine protease n=1 Tax=Babjeviella inositovora NRRL Y-12698 TaxID=984486 RepID=A0A1E3QVL0_9ASCO|nr:uncharacterized protein BABINDRAFT_159913 [Babjeviella inositovora NRRL Y-12698]ODQ81654.1 hypothetical protein BABINDRAFT_159913 [Babjeviella inositovora NRRL Y-12698]
MTSHNGLQKMFLHFWEDQGSTDSQQDIVLLGKTYHLEPDKESNEEALNPFNFDSFALFFQKPTTKPFPSDFLADVYTRLWLTYRSGFGMIPRATDGPSPVSISSIIRNMGEVNPAGFTSDAGWGCMIRTSQSLLANALQTMRLGRDYVFSSSTPIHDELVSWFNDTEEAPFSIHRFVEQGGKLCGKKPGEWFGPNAASRSIQALCHDFPQCGVNVYVSDTGDVYRDRILPLLDESPVLLLFSLRLGIDNVNPLYYDSLLQALALMQSVGIAGGRPASSHYFFGFQGHNMFYLDPHTLQAVSTSQETYHTKRISRISLQEMDPSMLIGFLVTSKEDLEDWVEKVTLNKIFHVSDEQAPSYQPSISIISDEDGDDFVDLGAEVSASCGGEEFEDLSGSVATIEPGDGVLVLSEPEFDEEKPDDSIVILSAPGSPSTCNCSIPKSVESTYTAVSGIHEEPIVLVEASTSIGGSIQVEDVL